MSLWVLLALFAPVGDDAGEAAAQRARLSAHPLDRALAWDDAATASTEAAWRLNAARAYAAAGPGFCSDARDRYTAALAPAASPPLTAADRAAAEHEAGALADRCQARVTLADFVGPVAAQAVPPPMPDGIDRPFEPVARDAQGLRLWPGAWHLRLGEGLTARYLTVCAAPGEALALNAAQAEPLPEDAKARSKAHNARGLAAAEQRCVAAAEFRLAADAALNEAYLVNAGVSLSADPPDCDGARQAFDAFLARCNVCRDRDDVLTRRRALERACEANLAVRVRPAGTVQIDGVPGLTRQVFRGRHVIRAEAAGHQPEQRTVWVQSDTRVDLDLRPAPPAAPASTVGSGPPSGLTEVVEPAPTSTSRRKVWGWTFGAAGLVIAGVGTGLLVAANGKDDDLAALNAKVGDEGVTRKAAQALADDRDTFAYTGGTLIGVGAVVITAGVVAWFWGDATMPVSVAPSADGFVVGGTF